jgi:hypothetical protein
MTKRLAIGISSVVAAAVLGGCLGGGDASSFSSSNGSPALPLPAVFAAPVSHGSATQSRKQHHSTLRNGYH